MKGIAAPYLGFRAYKLYILLGTFDREYGHILHRDYVGILFQYSLLHPSKTP